MTPARNQELKALAARAGVPARLMRWWTSLFEPSSLLPARAQRDLARAMVSAWQEEALCAQADPDAWFPRKGAAARPQVFRVCQRCPVQRPCLAAALQRSEYGVWAGTTAAQRRELFRLLRGGVPLVEVLDLALNRDQDQGQGMPSELGAAA